MLTLTRFFLFCLSSASFFFLSAFTPTITPPSSFTSCENSEIPGVIHSYIEKKMMKFSPSIVLFSENIKESKAEYEKKVKKHFSGSQENEIVFLPSLSTPYGKALVLQIDRKHQVGDLRLIQMILVHDKKSYIVTCCALKKEFPSYEKRFLETLQSLRFS